MSLNKSEALNMAKEYVLQRNVRAAISIYQEIIEADPADLTAINTLGDLYATTGLVQDAVAQFSRVADSYIESGFTRKAIATLKKMIAADPDNTETAIKLANMYAQAGLPSEALQHYLQIAGVYTRKGETLEALRIFNKIVQLDPSNPSTRIKLGELCLTAGMNEEAYNAFVTAAEQLEKKGEIRRALNAYNEALSLRPDNTETLAAVYRLTRVLGADPEKVRRGQALHSKSSGDLTDQNSATLTASDPTPELSPRVASTDELLVVQEISKAERLVAFGQVDQAISMLNAVLRNKPDNIDVHIKLKDICLRTGMTVEAAHEYDELARIHEARGEYDRARDYAVRANRLTQLIERPSGDLRQPEPKPVEVAGPQVIVPAIKLAPPREPEPKPVELAEPQVIAPAITLAPARKPEPKLVELAEPQVIVPAITLAPAREPEPKNIQFTRQLEADPPQPITLLVVPPAAISTEVVTIPDESPALYSDYVERPVSEGNRQNDLSFESALEEAPSLSTEASAHVFPTLAFASLPVERNRSRLKAAAVAATVLVLSVAGAVIGGFAYNAQLDKQYAALALATPPIAEQSWLPTPVSETEAIGDDQSMVVDVTAPPMETTPRPEKPQPEAIKNEPAASQPAPQPAPAEPAKVLTRSVPLPPRIAVNADGQAYNESRTPAGLAGEVPVTPTPAAAEPPPKAVRRSAGIVPAVAVKRVDPVYPRAAREALQTGMVGVEVTIDEQGNVTSARALSGPAMLRNAAIAAARGWKFKPSLLGGVPVSTTSSITFNFKL